MQESSLDIIFSALVVGTGCCNDKIRELIAGGLDRHEEKAHNHKHSLDEEICSHAEIPYQAKFHNKFGNLFCSLGKYHRAIEEYQKAILIYPQYAEAYYNLGLTYYFDLEEYNKAALYFKKFLRYESASMDFE